MITSGPHGIYGHPPEGLVDPPPGAIQFSPLVPGAAALEEQPPGSLAFLAMVAPSGTLERRYAIALALRSLQVGAPFVVLAPKDRGGARLAFELKAYGCDTSDDARRHHRICRGRCPAAPLGLEAAIAEGAPRPHGPSGLVTQPGLFSWDRIDPGSALLAPHLGDLAGRGADFGCGLGVLALAALASPKVTAIMLLDMDRRALEAARRNVVDPRAEFRWVDLRGADPSLAKLDFVVTNPPFHDSGAEDRSLGEAFIRRAAAALRPGGRLWLVANRHLAYELTLRALFKSVATMKEDSGYKVFEARK